MADPTPGRSAPRPLDPSATTAKPPTNERPDSAKVHDESLRAQADALGQKARGTAEQIKQEALDTAEGVKHEALEAAHQAKQQMRSMADRQKQAAAGQVSGFARALEAASDDLEDRGQEFAARYVEQAADGLSRLSDALEQRDFDQLMGGVEDFARRQPIAFLGGAVLAGFGLARLMKSSADRRRDAVPSGGEVTTHASAFPAGGSTAGNPGPGLAAPTGPTNPAGGAPVRTPGTGTSPLGGDRRGVQS